MSETTVCPIQQTNSEELEEQMTSKLGEFIELLNGISSLDSKMKALWRQIYENAITDRKHANIAYVDLYINCHSKPDMHAIHGPNLAKYLERMEKANGQLLKLAELVDKAKDNANHEDDEPVNIYDRLLKNKKKT